ncbi:MAG: lipopolysaccharide heptosyltransferase II [Desulfobacterales bacterium]|nr:lipopolysaccharide heptosyltransferase II [Desulfobacterales bacterium]
MKILIVQTSFLGDTILSTPVIKEVRNLYSGAEIWMMTTPLSSQLVENDPDLKGVITYDKRGTESGFKGLFRMAKKLKGMNFDIVYSLHKSYRTSALLFLSKIPKRIGFSVAKLGFLYHATHDRDPKDHDVVRNLSILSGDTDIRKIENTEMRLYPDKSENIDNKLTSRLEKLGKYAVLVPGSAWETKMWHFSEFKEAAQYLVEKGFKVVLLGAASDKKISEKVAYNDDLVDLSGKTSIKEAVYIVSKSILVVCNDSMSLHMASALKIPNLAIFCATVPEMGYGPWANKAIVVEKDIECRPCSRHGQRKCPLSTDECMHGLIKDAKHAIDGLLRES